MNRIVVWSLIAIAGIAFACGPRARSSDPEGRKVVAGEPILAHLEVNVRDRIEFELRVTNNTAGKLELLFPNGQTHELVVVDSGGRVVWRWSEGRMFTQALQNRILESSGTLFWDAAWAAKVPPGRYSAIATLLSENKPLEQRVEFEVR